MSPIAGTRKETMSSTFLKSFLARWKAAKRPYTERMAPTPPEKTAAGMPPMAKATMARTMPSEPTSKDPTRSFFSRGVFSRPIPEGVTGLKSETPSAAMSASSLSRRMGGAAPGTTEKAIFDFGLARRAFLHGYPSPAIRTHHAREKKKAGPRPASWLLSLTS